MIDIKVMENKKEVLFLICEACGKENSEKAKFCMQCGVPLNAPNENPDEPTQSAVEETSFKNVFKNMGSAFKMEAGTASAASGADLKQPSSIFGGVEVKWITLIVYLLPFLLFFARNGEYYAWIVPAAFLFLETKSYLVKFCAAQSLILELTLLLISVVFASIHIPSVFFIMFFSVLRRVVNTVLYISVAIASRAAFTYGEFKLPYVGKVADQLVSMANPIKVDVSHD
jgi:uncharacterized membrane protein